MGRWAAAGSRRTGVGGRGGGAGPDAAPSFQLFFFFFMTGAGRTAGGGALVAVDAARAGIRPSSTDEGGRWLLKTSSHPGAVPAAGEIAAAGGRRARRCGRTGRFSVLGMATQEKKTEQPPTCRGVPGSSRA